MVPTAWSAKPVFTKAVQMSSLEPGIHAHGQQEAVGILGQAEAMGAGLALESLLGPSRALY